MGSGFGNVEVVLSGLFELGTKVEVAVEDGSGADRSGGKVDTDQGLMFIELGAEARDDMDGFISRWLNAEVKVTRGGFPIAGQGADRFPAAICNFLIEEIFEKRDLHSLNREVQGRGMGQRFRAKSS